MSLEKQAVFFNAVPLLVLAAAYLGVSAAVAPTLWRERGRVTLPDLALALLFPCVGVPALVYGISVLHDERPIGSHIWPAFAGTLVALLPALLFLSRWREPALLLMSGPRAREAEQLVSTRDRELEAVAAVSNALARTQDPVGAGRVLLDEVAGLLRVDFAALMLIEAEREAVGLVARKNGRDVDWWPTVRIDLHREPSATASAYFGAAPLVIYDLAASPVASKRMVEATEAQSGAWIPLITEERVVGVLVVAPTTEKRAFTSDEVTLMQALASEAAIAIERTRSAEALDRALERERLVAEISRRARSVLDLDAVMRVAVIETGRALAGSRCFIRLSGPGESLPLRAEWFGEGRRPIGGMAENLPVSNLAARERRSVAVEDVKTAPELDDLTLGTRETLLELGSRSVLATPIIVFDRMIGVLGLHRPEPGPWSEADVGLIEAVARELGLAIHTAGLLEENRRRLAQQTTLLGASQVLTSELEFEAVIQRLVDEVARLLECEAADCYLLDAESGVLRCAAAHGLEGIVGFEFPSDRGLAGRAIAAGGPALSTEYDQIEEAVPHVAYEGFAGAIVAPMTWSGQTRGVLGVGTRDRDRRFTRSDAELLETFAGLASAALRNAESFEERSRQARLERGFSRVASVLGEPISLAETLNALAQAAAEALGGSSAAVLMPAGGELSFVGSHDVPRKLASFLEHGLGSPEDPLPTCARSRRTLAAASLRGDERFDDRWQRVLADARYGSLLAVPVEAPRGDDAGLVLVFFAGERRFSDADLELAQSLAGAARGALERSELFESERRARALAQQLASAAAVLATELDPAAVLDEVADQAPDLLDADAAAIRLLEGEELAVAAVRGEGVEEALGSRIPSTERLAGDVVQSRAPLALGDAGTDARLREADPILAAHAGYLGVPLLSPDGTLLGVLSVYSRRPRQWREEEIEALLALAGTAASSLSGAELYQQVALESERSGAILGNIADGIVAVDRDGKVVLWNSAAERITGVTATEALGRFPVDVLQRNLESGEEAPAGDDRLVSIQRGSEEVWLSLTEAVMRDPAGAVAGRIFAFRDISAERAVEQMKTEFVSTVSQELRRPLTSIYGFAETLLRQDVLFGEDERTTFLGYIASESERLTRIVDMLLNVARLDTGDLQVHLAPTDIASVVSEVVADAESSPALNGHRFVVDLPREPLTAAADREKLRQILDNLIDNAVKYSPSGGTVTVRARRNGEAVEVQVVDEGIGIPQGEQQRIFTKFYRAESTGRGTPGGGTGLGLFIAQGLVAAMGGRIWVDSREGHGSSFVFELPAARERVLAGD